MKNRWSNQIKIVSVSFFILTCLLYTPQVHAQSPDSLKKYRLYLEPYIMFTSLSGTTGVGNLPNTFICIPASKVFSYLKIGGMLYAEVHNDRFAFTSDLFYASLAQDASSKGNVISGTASMKQFWWELEGLYRLNPWLEMGVGARINNIQAGLDINTTLAGGNPRLTKTTTNTWVDPLVVARIQKWASKKWLFSLRGDIGGFGVGSQFAWQIQPDIFYRASRLLQLGIGYRAISMDYSKGTGNDRFLYDMDEYGPQIRIGFNF